MIDISHFFILGILLFSIGMVGVISRRNIFVMYMSMELMLNAINLNLLFKSLSRIGFASGARVARNQFIEEISQFYTPLCCHTLIAIPPPLELTFHNRTSISRSNLNANGWYNLSYLVQKQPVMFYLPRMLALGREADFTPTVT